MRSRNGWPAFWICGPIICGITLMGTSVPEFAERVIDLFEARTAAPTCATPKDATSSRRVTRSPDSRYLCVPKIRLRELRCAWAGIGACRVRRVEASSGRA
jgi:hypothetical protein